MSVTQSHLTNFQQVFFFKPAQHSILGCNCNLNRKLKFGMAKIASHLSEKKTISESILDFLNMAVASKK